MADRGNFKRTGQAPSASFPNKLAPAGWVVRFPIESLPRSTFEVWHGFAKGPGGYFVVYRGDNAYGVGENGFINEYAPGASAMLCSHGEEIYFYWSIGTGDAPEVTLYFRDPEVGRL